jgi:hypothetical protein
MKHPKNTNAYTGGHFVEGPGVILSDYVSTLHFAVLFFQELFALDVLLLTACAPPIL